MTYLSHLECGNCSARHESDRLQSRCVSCSGPLLARYRLTDALPSLEEVLSRPPGQHRFHEVLPNATGPDTPTLGEGATPLLAAPGLGPAVWVKDEAQNPTGSFKARGMAVALARSVELGATRFHLPSNGNAGAAAAAYAALHGVTVTVTMPANTPEVLVAMAELSGAEVIGVEGTIADAAALLADRPGFSLATLAEPYRIEGKKMMGYEVVWDLGRLPDVIFYPTGGGTGLVGMVKAFDEMEQLGWIDSERPKMVAVQSDACAPIVRAFNSGAVEADPWDDPGETKAFGLRVPSAIGDRLMLSGLRDTGGTAVAVSEDELARGTRRLASATGILGSPEGGACLAAYEILLDDGWLTQRDEVVLFNTGAAANYH
ncbi:MAG TPA: threonine synthase [Acidimicrobiia bacterium]